MPYMPEMHSMPVCLRCIACLGARQVEGLYGASRAPQESHHKPNGSCVPQTPFFSLFFTFLARSDASTSDLTLDFMADHKESLSSPFFDISCIFPDPEGHFFLSFLSDLTCALSTLASPDRAFRRPISPRCTSAHIRSR